MRITKERPRATRTPASTEIYRVETILRHASALVLTDDFRSAATGTNQVLCTVYAPQGRDLARWGLSRSAVRINEATVLDHISLRLPL